MPSEWSKLFLWLYVRCHSYIPFFKSILLWPAGWLAGGGCCRSQQQVVTGGDCSHLWLLLLLLILVNASLNGMEWWFRSDWVMKWKWLSPSAITFIKSAFQHDITLKYILNSPPFHCQRVFKSPRCSSGSSSLLVRNDWTMTSSSRPTGPANLTGQLLVKWSLVLPIVSSPKESRKDTLWKCLVWQNMSCSDFDHSTP